MNILKISFQYSTYTAKETPFHSQIMRYNDLKQTNTLFLRENRNQNASNQCECFLHTCRLNQLGHMDTAGARYTKSIASRELRHKEHNNDPYPLHNNTIDFT